MRVKIRPSRDDVRQLGKGVAERSRGSTAPPSYPSTLKIEYSILVVKAINITSCVNQIQSPNSMDASRTGPLSDHHMKGRESIQIITCIFEIGHLNIYSLFRPEIFCLEKPQ